ncbi:MAG: hypothetical protein AAFQ44_05300, partial [Pseudomonadota bacterium]
VMIGLGGLCLIAWLIADVADVLFRPVALFDRILSSQHYLNLISAAKTTMIALGVTAFYVVCIWLVGFWHRIAISIRVQFQAFEQLMTATIYLLLFCVAVLPISLLIYHPEFLALQFDARILLSLALINGLLYFVATNYLEYLDREAGELYIASAQFKSETLLAFSSGAAMHFLAARAGSIYFFVLAFSFVPSVLEANRTGSVFADNIVATLLQIVVQKGILSSDFGAPLLMFVFVALVVRLVTIDLPVYGWGMRNGLSSEAE